MSGTVAIFFWIILLAILGLVGLMLYFFFFDYLRKNTWGPRIISSVFLEVTVPKENSDPNQEAAKEEKDIIAIAEQFFSTIVDTGDKAGLHNFLNIHEYISFEIAAVGKKISFYINTPRKLQALIEKQLHAQYPKAQIEEIEGL
jgi:hypothetical protein